MAPVTGVEAPYLPSNDYDLGLASVPDFDSGASSASASSLRLPTSPPPILQLILYLSTIFDRCFPNLFHTLSTTTPSDLLILLIIVLLVLLIQVEVRGGRGLSVVVGGGAMRRKRDRRRVDDGEEKRVRWAEGV